MRRLFCPLMTALLLLVAAAGCSQAPAAPPAQAPPAPKATEPAKAAAQPTAAAQQPTAAPPTAVPAKKVDFPEKGKPITLLNGYAAGGGSDIAARTLAPFLEKELGVPVQVVNKPGAAQQVVLTEFLNTKPDGHTLLYLVMPGATTSYLDPDRKATYSLKDWQPVALHMADPGVVAVQAGSNYQGLKDLVDAAKAAPDKVKIGYPGIMTMGHLLGLQWMQMAGVQVASVQFEGTAPAVTALAGGHVDGVLSTVGGMLPLVKSGQLRVIGVADKQESKHMPGIKTFQAQGYNLTGNTSDGVIAPMGTPKEIVEILSAAIKKACADPDQLKRLDEQAIEVRYMDAATYGTFLSDIEKELKPLVEYAKKH